MPEMALYNVFAVITVLAAVFGYINYRFIKLPGTIGIMIISLLFSLLAGNLTGERFAVDCVHPRRSECCLDNRNHRCLKFQI